MCLIVNGGIVAAAEQNGSIDIPIDGKPEFVPDIRFSPNGRWIAVVFTDDRDCFKHPATMHYQTRIYDVSRRNCAYQFNFGETSGWNAEGTLLAVANGVGDKITLIDVKTGKASDSLEYLPKQLGIVKRLAFDQAGNLYGAIEGSTDDPTSINQVLSTQVWWNAKRNETKRPSQIVGTCGLGCPLDLSVAQIGREVRVAIARFNGIEIQRVTKGNTGQPTVVPEHKIEGLKNTFVRLTPDGRRLVVCGETGVSLFELGSSPPRLIFEDKKKVNQGLWNWFYLYFPNHCVDVSADSRLFVVPGSTNEEIILAKNGQLVAKLPRAGSVAISPDGQFIAAFAKGAKGVVLRLSRVASLQTK